MNPILDISMVVPREVDITWPERLFSWPWRPWRRTRTVMVPSQQILRLPGGRWVMHPETWIALRAVKKYADESKSAVSRPTQGGV